MEDKIMTFIEEIRTSLEAYGITSYTDEQIEVFIDNAKSIIDSPLLENREYTDYVRGFDGDVYCTDFYPVLELNSLTIDEKEVTPEASFTNDLGADSLDTVELIMELEKEFDVQIPDDQAEKIATVGDAIAYIENATK